MGRKAKKEEKKFLMSREANIKSHETLVALIAAHAKQAQEEMS